MAGNSDFLNILREIRGSAAPGQPLTDGIWYELTVADKNGNPGIYGDILAKYGIVTESAGTFDQAVAILENLNVEITTLPAGSDATSALVNGVWQIGLPRGIDGTQGIDGNTPEVAIAYDSGNLGYTVTVDGAVVTNTNLLNLDTLVDSIVSTNVGVHETLEAKQDVLDAVATAQGISDSFDANAAIKKQEIDTFANTRMDDISLQAELEKTELDTHASAKVNEYNNNALSKLNQYNDNHTNKLNTYNTNDSIKLNQYNENHIERLSEINYAYADRIVEMIKTRNFMGIMDEYVAQTDTHMITFLDTTDANYIYYANGTLLTENVDYTVYDNKTIELTVKANPYDVIVQVNTQVLNDMLTAEGSLFADRIGQPNGLAGLDSTGKVPAEQLPSYVDDVIEVATYASLPVTGETDKIYVVVADETSGGDTSSYRWTGTVYAMISNSLTAADIKVLYESVANKVLTSVDSLQFSGGTGTQGTISWNADEETVDLVQNGAVLQLGQEVQTHVRNTTASIISSGKVVMVTGTIGASGRITVGLYDGVSEVKYILGVCTEDIAAGDDGKVTHFGKVRGVNTSAWNEGDLLYPTTNGDFTNVAPASGVRLALAIVITKHATNGTIMVRANGVNENAYEPKNANIQTHITDTNNPHSVTKAQVGLSNVNNTADNVKNVATATKWATARTITLDGDVVGSASVDGSANVTIATTVQPNSVALGTDTTGNYMVNVTAGSGISVSHTQGEGSTATITNSAPNVTTNITTAHSATNVIVNSSDGTDGTINSATQTLAGVMSAVDKTKLDGIEAGATGDQTASEILTLLKTVDGSGSGVDADLLDGQEGAYYLNASNINTGTIDDARLPDTITSSITGNAATATKLATARTINGVSFDGTANIVAPTNLGITAGTTAGPIITSSTGSNVTLPTASASASGVVTTGNQTIAGVKTFSSTIAGSINGNAGSATKLATARTINGVSFDGSANITVSDSTAVKLTGDQTIAGVKTFSSSPIVPTPTGDNQATTARSTNITVNVGAGQTYTTINQALEYLSGFYPLYKQSGITATINLKAGFVMNEQVLVSGLNLGWITIVGEDPETIITHTALTTAFNGEYYPAFGVDKGGTSPIIGQLFRFNVEKVGGNKHGLMAFGASSSAEVSFNKGFIGAGTHGVYAAAGSTIGANNTNVSNAGNTGFTAGQCSIICAAGVNASNAGTYGIRANQGSTIDANGANFAGAGTTGAVVERGSVIFAGGSTGSYSQTANTLTGYGIIYQ